MKILIFTEGTVLTHRDCIGLPRDQIVEQVRSHEGPVGIGYFKASVPIGDCVGKIEAWKKQGATILYLTSRKTPGEVRTIKNVLGKYRFPEGELLFRTGDEEYCHVAERALPDVIVEDDCESIGGEKEMTYPRIRPELKSRIKSVVVREFAGIDHLPDSINDLAAL